MRIFDILASVSLLVASAYGNQQAENATCLLNSLSFGADEETGSQGVLLESFGFLLEGDLLFFLDEYCGDNTANCDLSGTDVYTTAATSCEANEGKFFLESLDVCGGAIKAAEGIQDDTTVPDVSFSNIPICLSPVCPDDSQIFEMLKPFLGTGLLSTLGGFETLLTTDDCAESTESGGNSDNGSQSSKAHSLGLSLITSGLALVASAFFTV